MKYLSRLLLPTIISIAGVLFTFTPAQAETGWCVAQGGPHAYNFMFSKTIADVNQTAANTIVDGAYEWSSGHYSGKCDSSQSGTAYFKGEMSGSLPFDKTVDGISYYALNDYLSAAVEIGVWDSGNKYMRYLWIPFSDVSNNSNEVRTKFGGSWGTGSEGKLNLLLRKKITANVIINTQPIAYLYGTMNKGSYGQEAIAIVSIGGELIVPQECVINEGTDITIDLKDIWASDFKAIGQKPDKFTPQKAKIDIECTNMDVAAQLELRFEATPASAFTDAIASNKSDIGVVLLNKDGAVVPPNSGNIPFALIDDNMKQSASVEISAYPVRLGATFPAVGDFEAIATIRMTYQ